MSDHSETFTIIIILITLILYAFFGALLEHYHVLSSFSLVQFKYIHETGIGILMGMLMAMIKYFIDGHNVRTL
jgi:hypothetical protein